MSEAPEYTDNTEIQAMLRETRRCLACGQLIRRGHGFKVKVGYCSARCYQTKPPKMAYAEKVYGKPIKVLMVELLNTTNPTEAVGDFLGISKHTLYQWIKKLKIRKVVRYE